MEQNLKQGHFSFDGKFTSESRKSFQVKRLELGLAYQRLASFFETSWSTIRKWEMGPTACCRIRQRPKIEKFLKGEYDKELLEKQRDPLLGSYPQQLPECVYKCMEKFNTAYHLLRYRPDLRENLLQGINRVTREILQSLINTEMKNEDE